jgi:hypothetical protein
MAAFHYPETIPSMPDFKTRAISKASFSLSWMFMVTLCDHT